MLYNLNIIYTEIDYMRYSKDKLIVILGFDDNSQPNGVEWVSDTIASYKNPDGSTCSCDFYCTTLYADKEERPETYKDVRSSWEYAHKKGHKINNHTHSHRVPPKDADYWEREIKKSTAILKDIVGCDLEDMGFRAPFLTVNSTLTSSLESLGLLFDSSEGKWYELDNHDGGTYVTKTQRGLWLLGVTPIKVPTSAEWSSLGMEPISWDDIAHRSPRMAGTPDSSVLRGTGSITGFDQGALLVFKMSSEEWGASLVRTVDYHIEKSWGPVSLGFHSETFANTWDFAGDTTVEGRRSALIGFLDYVNSKQNAYIVSTSKAIDMMFGDGN